MSTDTLPETIAEPKTTNPKSKNSWLAIAVMFVAGLASGGLALSLVAHQGEKSRSATGDAEQQPVSAPTTQNDAAALEEIRELREQVDQLRGAAQSGNASNAEGYAPNNNVANERRPATSSALVGQRTLAYWNQLNSIMSREAAMRAAPQQLTAGNAMSFVSGRTSAFEYAGSAIRQLSTQGVDPQVVAIARDIAAWYDQGLANSREAESLLGSNDVAARQGAAGKGWQSAEKRHREECLTINRRGEQLRQELSRRYRLDFPPMQ